VRLRRLPNRPHPRGCLQLPVGSRIASPRPSFDVQAPHKPTGKPAEPLRTTAEEVRNILLENGFDPGPKRGQGSWDEFIRMHAKTLWACDFLSVKAWTLGGLVEYSVLFFIQPGTRQVHIAGITANPNAAWMAQQARNMCMFFADQPEQAR
jgi:hypothetical protein